MCYELVFHTIPFAVATDVVLFNKQQIENSWKIH